MTTQRRTDAEIVERIRNRRGADFFGFETSDLVMTLPFEAAREFLKPDAAAEAWDSDRESAERTAVLDRMRQYLPFAWDKANGCRGLSAARSLSHFAAWLWLVGETAAADALANYDRYGKPQLAAVSDWLGFDWRAHDNGAWVNGEDGPRLSADAMKPAALPFLSPKAEVTP